MPDATNDPKQDQRPRGIAAAAIDGAKEGGRPVNPPVNPDDVSGSLARPAPGMTERPEPAPSSTNQYTGITGGLTEDEDDDDDDQEWRRAGGAGAEGAAGGGNADAADGPRER